MKAVTKFSQLDITKKYTYADYLTWQFKDRVELIKGCIHKMSPAPNVKHQTTSWNLTLLIGNYLTNSKCKAFAAPFDVRLYKVNTANVKIETVVQPDICIVCNINKLDEKGCLGAPDLIIEIVSPGNSKKDLKTKFDLYQNNGVLEYWVANPLEKSVQQFYLENNKYKYIKTFFTGDQLESKIIKGLIINLNKVFL